MGRIGPSRRKLSGLLAARAHSKDPLIAFRTFRLVDAGGIGHSICESMPRNLSGARWR